MWARVGRDISGCGAKQFKNSDAEESLAPPKQNRGAQELTLRSCSTFRLILKLARAARGYTGVEEVQRDLQALRRHRRGRGAEGSLAPPRAHTAVAAGTVDTNNDP